MMKLFLHHKIVTSLEEIGRGTSRKTTTRTGSIECNTRLTRRHQNKFYAIVRKREPRTQPASSKTWSTQMLNVIHGLFGGGRISDIYWLLRTTNSSFRNMQSICRRTPCPWSYVTGSIKRILNPCRSSMAIISPIEASPL